MNVLMTGSGKGSWVVRGNQLGGAIGARLVKAPSDDDIRWADVVVLIKRALAPWAEFVHRFGKPIVWDAVDFWEQPEQNGLSETDAKILMAEMIACYRPALVIGATVAMARDAGGVYLPHHTRPDLTPAPARAIVTTVGYEGTRKYLGHWGGLLEQECARRGWRFVVNPADLRELDLVVAFRDGEWDGWMCREWKSGVKVGNAMAAGRPIITQASAAFSDLGAHGSVVETRASLCAAFDYWASFESRRNAVDQAWAERLTLNRLAADYTRILADVAARRAA